MIRQSPSAHPEAFAWVLVVSTALYLNFAWFREQLCVVLCPYGRLQSALLDEHSLVVGYDAAARRAARQEVRRGRRRLRRLQALRRRLSDRDRHPQRRADGVHRVHGVHRRVRRHHGQAGPAARARPVRLAGRPRRKASPHRAVARRAVHGAAGRRRRRRASRDPPPHATSRRRCSACRASPTRWRTASCATRWRCTSSTSARSASTTGSTSIRPRP